MIPLTGRSISDYFFTLGKIRGRSNVSDPKKAAIGSMEISEYVDYISTLPADKVRNLQCRYLSSTGSFEDARKVVDDDVIYLCAPLERLDDFYTLLAGELSLKEKTLGHLNVGSHRPKDMAVDEKTRSKIEALFDQDLQLYRYVCERFDEVAEKWL